MKDRSKINMLGVGFSEAPSNLILPYMAPDNNAELTNGFAESLATRGANLTLNGKGIK